MCTVVIPSIGFVKMHAVIVAVPPNTNSVINDRCFSTADCVVLLFLLVFNCFISCLLCLGVIIGKCKCAT